MKIIPEEEYNAMSPEERKKYDKKMQKQFNEKADNAVATGAKVAAVGTAAYGAYGWLEWLRNNDDVDVDGGKKRRKSLKKKRKTKKRLGGMEDLLNLNDPERVPSTLTTEYVNRIRPGDDFLVPNDYDNLAGTSLDPDPTRPVAVPRLYTVISVSDIPDRDTIRIIASAKNPRLTVNRMRVIDYYLNNGTYNVRYADAYDNQEVRGGMESVDYPERVPSELTREYVKNRIRPGDDFVIRNDFDEINNNTQDRLYTVISVRDISNEDENKIRIIAIATNNDLTGDQRDRRVIDYFLNDGTYIVRYEDGNHNLNLALREQELRARAIGRDRTRDRARGGMNDAMEKNRLYFLRRTRTRAREPEPVPESVEVFNMGALQQSLPINTRRKRGSYKQNSRKKRNTSKTPSSRKRSKSLGGRRTKRRRQ